MMTDTNSKSSKMTIDGLKAWARENHDLAMAVVKAQAFAQVERERVDAYIRPIFAAYAFTDDLAGDGSRILTDPKDIYLSEDEDACRRYFAECDRAHREHGFDGPEGHCPALVAEDLQRQVEDLLLNSLAMFSGAADEHGRHEYSRTLEIRAKALDLALTVCLGRLS